MYPYMNEVCPKSSLTALKLSFLLSDFYEIRLNVTLIRVEMIANMAKRGIIDRMRYNTSFGLYKKIDVLTYFNSLAAIQKVACYRYLHILTESEQNYFHQSLEGK